MSASSPRRRAVAALIAASALLLSACTAVVSGSGSRAAGSLPSGSATAPLPGTLSFGSCDGVLNVSAIPIPAGLQGKVDLSCAKLQVPLDYSDPGGTKIGIEMLRVHLKNTPGQPLLINPGGPGGSGIELAANLTGALSSTLLKTFDLIGFDPRGVGLSSPIRCVSDAEKDTLTNVNYDVLTTSGFDDAKALAKTVADACSQRYGAALAQYNTVNTARDMDQLRAAFGETKLDYLGFSYGTELGAQYAHLFPGHVGQMVLDGAVNPLTGPIESFANQIAGFEGAFNQFAQWCATSSSCKKLGNPRQLVYTLTAQADKTPIPESSGKRKASGNIVLTGVLSALYSRSSWPTLATALGDAKNDDSSGLFQLADQYNQRYSDGTYSNIFDANTTISCNDSPPGPTDAEVTATAKTWSTKYPMFGLWAAQSLFLCAEWQPVRTVPPLPTATNATTTLLVLGNLHDPATPYAGAIALTKTLGRAELLSWNGEGHTSYLEGSNCIDDAVNAYLEKGTLPPANTTCPR